MANTAPDTRALTHRLLQETISAANAPTIVNYEGSASYTAGAATLTANAVNGPDGTLTADTIADTAATAVHGMTRTAALAVTNGAWFSVQIFARLTSAAITAGLTTIQYGVNGGLAPNFLCVFDLVNGVVVDGGTPTFNAQVAVGQLPYCMGSIQPAVPATNATGTGGIQWFRCMVTVFGHSQITGANVNPALQLNGGQSYLGTAITVLHVAKPVSPVNYSEIVSMQDAILLNGRNTR